MPNKALEMKPGTILEAVSPNRRPWSQTRLADNCRSGALVMRCCFWSSEVSVSPPWGDGFMSNRLRKVKSFKKGSMQLALEWSLG